jgi:hypothetical protein
MGGRIDSVPRHRSAEALREGVEILASIHGLSSLLDQLDRRIANLLLHVKRFRRDCRLNVILNHILLYRAEVLGERANRTHELLPLLNNA